MPDIIRKTIRFIGGMTLGIYCMHIPIGMIYSHILHLNIDSLLFCVIVFTSGLILSIGLGAIRPLKHLVQ